ncbi:gluconate 2-dehydrogenase subunit 3 family protein [Rhodobacteraceae bacterium B1Z28]|uniref:Gluconate 2-dehydrogenase subunit 3 family protein n=1 Tax=Ruegeria haliotis TaxID=2747601 RepID=A0ABX2PZW5_9RHOB|nr:gluconate 2-dehydrogenase subunit 3 family protein [Ruegeria haliotis]NVO58622.1 gluconate 2-dehydrogenase subunit 3 family protein [Ruegeria haliotis]
MMGRRRFFTGIIPTTVWTSIAIRSLSCNAEAKTVEQTSFLILSTTEAETLSAWCNVIVTGAGNAGVAQFVDQSLSRAQLASLLLLRYLDASDMTGFYRNGIAGIEKESAHRFAQPFVQLTKSQQTEMIADAVASKMQVWSDPDPNFFYFISRSDAVDVVYGTEAGFVDLGIPYLAHITPPQPW